MFETSSVEFSRDVYRELLANNGINSDLFFSPLSIYSALSLAFAGSATTSREEFLTVLHLTEQGDGTNLLKMLGDELKSIFEQDVQQTMVQANGLFIDGRLHLLDQYKEVRKEHFDAEFKEVNFAAATQAARFINSWIDKNTHEKIRNMIDPSALSYMTRLVLANAVYFKGSWRVPFPKHATQKDAPFFTLDGEDKSVQMMRLRAKLQSADFDSFQARAV